MDNSFTAASYSSLILSDLELALCFLISSRAVTARFPLPASKCLPSSKSDLAQSDFMGVLANDRKRYPYREEYRRK